MGGSSERVATSDSILGKVVSHNFDSLVEAVVILFDILLRFLRVCDLLWDVVEHSCSSH